MEFSRQEYWSGLPFPSPGDLPDPGIEPGSPSLQVDSFGFFGGLVIKNLPTNAEEADSIPGSGRSPGEGTGNLLQYSCPENNLWIEEPGGLQSMGLQRAGHN